MSVLVTHWHQACSSGLLLLFLCPLCLKHQLFQWVNYWLLILYFSTYEPPHFYCALTRAAYTAIAAFLWIFFLPTRGKFLKSSKTNKSESFTSVLILKLMQLYIMILSPRSQGMNWVVCNTKAGVEAMKSVSKPNWWVAVLVTCSLQAQKKLENLWKTQTNTEVLRSHHMTATLVALTFKKVAFHPLQSSSISMSDSDLWNGRISVCLLGVLHRWPSVFRLSDLLSASRAPL